MLRHRCAPICFLARFRRNSSHWDTTHSEERARGLGGTYSLKQAPIRRTVSPSPILCLSLLDHCRNELAVSSRASAAFRPSRKFLKESHDT
jgi:hypothetical protein